MKLLRRHNASRGFVETILHARVPIIKFMDGPTGVPWCQRRQMLPAAHIRSWAVRHIVPHW